MVTGGTTGIGLATAKRFAEEGAYVYITGRRQAELDKAVALVGNATGIAVDSTRLDQLDELYARISKQHGQLDVLFANAGGGSMLPLGDITEAHYDDTFNRNVKGVLFTVQKALPLLARNASIILTGSTAGSSGTAAFSVYSASKAAVRAFARSWILDLKDRGVRVHTLSPGATRTPGSCRPRGAGCTATARPAGLSGGASATGPDWHLERGQRRQVPPFTCGVQMYSRRELLEGKL